jgi:hypothetical protein
MKKLIMAVLTVTILLTAGEKVKMSTVLSGDYFSKGFSADVKMTSDMPMMPVMEPYKIYTDGDGNSRTEMKDNISLYIEEKGKDMIYNYDKKSKTYTVMSLDDMPGGMQKPDEFEEEELVEKAGSAMFAGVKCDRYKIIIDDKDKSADEEMQGESYIFVDPVKKIVRGMETKMGEYSMKMEYSNIKQGVDKSMFKPLQGYKKVETAPMGGFDFMR